MPLKRVMTVARMASGALAIHNGIALEEAAMSLLEAAGRPAYILVPNGYHRLDAPAFKQRYPEAAVLCPRGARAKVAQVLPVDGAYEDFPEDEAVQLEPIEGIAHAEGVMIVKSEDGATLVFNDLLFNMPHGRGLGGFIFNHITQSTGGPKITRLMRWFMLKDRRALRANLERLAETPNLKRIIVSHHRMITEDPANVLKAVAATL